jgi:NADPH:quinone reductase-like Zn-dependent oxidoreductase
LKAIVFTRYGSPDVLELRDVERPVPADDEVLIRVQACSLNDGDAGGLDGSSIINRMIFGLRKPKPEKRILGSDVAGIVEAAGKNVGRFRSGDRVFGDLSGTWGGLAEYVCAKETALALMSPGMTFEQAAAIPQAGMLAVQGLRDAARMKTGQALLVNGAGGGAGTFAVQLARIEGVEITAVDSGPKLDLLRSLGASHVIDYTREDFTRGDRRYDVILDVKTSRSIFECTRVLNRGGMYVTMGGSTARLLQSVLMRPLISLAGKRAGLVVLKPNKDLELMKELFEAGKVVPVIDGPYELSQTAEAFRRFIAARHIGKVVIRVR